MLIFFHLTVPNRPVISVMLNMLIFAHWRGGQIAKTWCFNLRVIPATRPEAQLFIEKNPMHQSHGGTYTGDFVKGKRHLAAKCDGPVKDEADISTTYLNDSQCMSYSFLVIGNPRLQPWISLCQWCSFLFIEFQVNITWCNQSGTVHKSIKWTTCWHISNEKEPTAKLFFSVCGSGMVRGAEIKVGKHDTFFQSS